MTSDELTHWQAFAQIDGPFLPQRLDCLTGINCVASACMGGKTKVDDWLPEWDQGDRHEVDYQTGAEMFVAWARGVQGKTATVLPKTKG